MKTARFKRWTRFMIAGCLVALIAAPSAVAGLGGPADETLRVSSHGEGNPGFMILDDPDPFVRSVRTVIVLVSAWIVGRLFLVGVR